jgi:hypothetical protein
MPLPPTGLIGAEASTRGGLDASLQALGMGLNTARGDLSAGMNAASQPLQGFQNQGMDAASMQAALSGAAGMPQQQQAYDQFQFSPAQQFQQAEAEKARIRNASATGGLGGNNLQRALGRDAVAFGSMAINDKFNQLGQVANRGFQAGNALSGIQERGGQGMSNLALQSGVMPAQMISNAAGNVANQRFSTGQQLAQAIGGTSASMANLQNQLGGGLANIAGQSGQNLANLVSNTGQLSAQQQNQLAVNLAASRTGQSMNVADQINLAGQYDAAGILGKNEAIQSALGPLFARIAQ